MGWGEWGGLSSSSAVDASPVELSAASAVASANAAPLLLSSGLAAFQPIAAAFLGSLRRDGAGQAPFFFLPENPGRCNRYLVAWRPRAPKGDFSPGFATARKGVTGHSRLWITVVGGWGLVNPGFSPLQRPGARTLLAFRRVALQKPSQVVQKLFFFARFLFRVGNAARHFRG